jgi:MYXO-CTERM domain-containing protein
VSIAGTTFDTQLFLFDASGFGLLANDNIAPGGPPLSGFGNMSTDGTDIEILEPGTYLLAISGSDSDPLGINPTTGGLEAIFDMPFGSFEVSGPDGTGGMSPISGWSGPGATGDYLIELVGTDFATSPSPGALAMVLLAGCARRRRRG